MQSLKKWQEDFVRYIARAQSEDLDNKIKSHGTDPKELLQIYSNNTYQTLRKAIEISYPSLWKLFGNDAANSLAFAYARANLPQTGCLDDWGGSFPQFVADFSEIQAHPYVPDMMTIDWYCQNAYLHGAEEQLDPNDLLDIEEAENAQFTFGKSFSLFASRFPLEQIFRLVEEDASGPVDLGQGGSYVLIGFKDFAPTKYWVTQHEFVFFKALYEGLKLKDATQLALQSSEDFDLFKSLGFALQEGFFQHVRVGEKQ